MKCGASYPKYVLIPVKLVKPMLPQIKCKTPNIDAEIWTSKWPDQADLRLKFFWSRATCSSRKLRNLRSLRNG